MRTVGKRCSRRETGCALRVNLILALALIGVLAHDRSSAQAPARLSIAYVPADQPQAWPKGEWSLVATDDLLRFQSRAGPSSIVGGGVLEQAVYRGQMLPAVGLDGECEWTVIGPAADGGFVDLGDPTLAVDGLLSGDVPAIWGTSPDDRRLLLTQSGRANVTGHWSARGQLRFGRFECEFELPPAGMNRLELSAPKEWALVDASGMILGPHATNDPGVRRWDVELGRRTRCWLQWGLASSSTPRSDLQCERTLTYSVRPDGSRLQADFSIRAHGSVPRELMFRLPPQLDHPTVSWSNGTYLPGRPDDSVPGRFIVPLPILNPGHLGVLRIVADMPTIENDDWSLPEIDLENCRLLAGTRAVAVDRPLTMKNYDAVGLRAVGVDDDERGADWSFSEQQHDASLNVRVGRPEPQFVGRIATEVDRQSDASSFESIVEITTRAGSAFTAEFLLPTGWDVLDVQASNGDSALTGWSSEESGDGVRLMVEFRQAVYGQSKKTLRIVGRGPPTETPQPLPIPAGFVDWDLLWGMDAAGLTDSANPPGDEWDELLDLLQADMSMMNWQRIDPTTTMLERPAQTVETLSPPSVRHVEPTGPSVSGLCLESWILPGESWRCRHRATYLVHGAASGLQFTLDPTATLDSVLVDGELHATELRGETTVLASLLPDARTIEVRYHTDAVEAGPLSAHLRVVVPEWNIPVGEAEWRVHVPEGWLAFIDDAPVRVPWSAKLFGWAGREATTSGDTSELREITYRTVPCPRTFAVRVWNQRQRTLAYIMTVLITASLTIVVRLSGVLRAVWYPVSLAGAACAALLGPPAATPVLSGLVVGLIAGGLFPRRWIVAPERSWSASELSGRSSVHVARLVILILGVATTLAAQQPDESESAADAAVADALVPIDDDGVSAFAYLDSQLVPELQRWLAAHPAQPSTLIRSARYEKSAADPALIHATFDVLAFGESAALRLPLSDVTFRSPDDCFVDGQRRTIQPAADGNGYFVDVSAPGEQVRNGDGPRVVDVSLWMRFRESSILGRTEASAAIPRVLDSAVQAGSESPFSVLDPFGTVDDQRNQVRFGSRQRLRLTPDAGVVKVPRGAAATVVDVHPLRLEVQSKLRLERDAVDRSQRTRRVSILLPTYATVTEVTGAGVQRWRVWTAERQAVVDVTVSGSEPAEDVVDLKYIIPVDTEQTAIEIPPLEMLPAGGLSRHDIGVRPANGFVIEQAPPALPALPRETVAARFPRDAGWTEPELAVSLDAPASIAVSLTRRATRLEGGLSETWVVEADRVSWEAAIDVDVSGAGVLRLIASIPDHVYVNSCAVLQDGANRLLGWARDGEHVVMHLRDDRLGVYEVLMSGWSTDEDLVRVPELDLVGASVVAREFSLRNESRDQIERLDADQSQIPERGDASASAADSAAAQRPALLRRIHTRDRFNTLTTVANQADGVAIDTYVELDGSELPPTVFLEVPPELAAGVRVEPQEWLKQTRMENFGGVLLTIEPASGATHVAVKTTVPAARLSEPRLRVPQVVEADVIEQFLSLSAASRLGPVESSAAPSAAGEVPVALRDLIKPQSKVYRIDARELRLQPRTEPSVADVDLVETGVWETPDGVAGRTLVHLRNADTAVLRLQQPESVSLDSVLVDGRPVIPAERSGRQVTVRIDADPGLHQVLLRWSTSDQRSTDGALEIPIPVGHADFVHLAAVAGSENTPRAPGDVEIRALELRRRRVDALLSSLELLPEGNATGVAETVETLSADFAALDRLHDPAANDNERRARWETARASARAQLNTAVCPTWAIPTGMEGLTIRELDSDESQIVIPAKSWMQTDMSLPITLIAILAILALAVRFRVDRFDSDGRRLVLLGALWWMCLRMAPLGLALMAVGIVIEVMHRRRGEPATESPAT